MSDTELLENVSAEKLMALLRTSNEMMQGIFRHDPQTMLRTVVRHIYDLLEAEACAIFLVSEDSPEELILEAAYTTKSQYDFQPVRTKIQSSHGEGLVGHIADKKEIVNLNYDDILREAYIDIDKLDYLLSKRCFSSLGVPLKNRKDHVLGVLKVDNKKNKFGEPDEKTCFSLPDTFAQSV